MQLTGNYFHKLNPDTTGTTGTILCEPKIVPVVSVVSNSFETTRTIGTTGTIIWKPGFTGQCTIPDRWRQKQVVSDVTVLQIKYGEKYFYTTLYNESADTPGFTVVY